MKKHVWSTGAAKRLAALALALCLTTAPALADAVPASAPAAISPVCDEAFYATLDYYGQLTDSSVVKSYLTNGSNVITDYGTYSKVINLTDSRSGEVGDGTVKFDLSGDVPTRFYFEGKTDQPFRDLPWTIALSYRLNGVDTPAEDLAGKTGVVEIHLDVTPNSAASAYSRDNLALTAMTALNADEILSLEAEGAQVQLLGNLRAVLCMVLPGEERHFVIRVGSDDFTFPGMVFLAVPATLAQLDQVAELREAKDKTQASYDAVNESLDLILNTLNGMSGNLNATADGLEQLNAARSTISSGKGEVYASADKALANLDTAAASLAPAAEHLSAASQALTDITGRVTALTDNAVALKGELENCRAIITRIQGDTQNLRNLAGSVESYNKAASNVANNMKTDLGDLSDAMKAIQTTLAKLSAALTGMAEVKPIDKISVGGMTSAAEVQAKVAEVSGYHTQYEQYLAGNHLTGDQLSFSDFLVAAAYQKYAAAYQQQTGKTISQADFLKTAEGKTATATAAQAAQLYAAAQQAGFADQLSQMESANTVLIPTANNKITEINAIVKSLAVPTAAMVNSLNDLCGKLNADGLGGDLTALSKLCADVLAELKAHEGEAAAATGHLDELGSLAARVSENAGTALDLVKALSDTVNQYVPGTQKALSDAKTLADATASGIQNMDDFLRSAESLMKRSDAQLDAGTRQTLNALAESLRRSTAGLSQTGTLRNAKDAITTLIDDEWNAHTGQSDNLLLADPTAPAVSLTSEKNSSPSSIQYILRSQEIKKESGEKAAEKAEEAARTGSVWSRIGAMFRDFWNAITGIFHRE